MTTEKTIVFPEGTPDPARIAYLIAGYINEALTEEEHDELDKWVCENDDNMRLFEELTDEKTIAYSLEQLSKLNPAVAFQILSGRIKSQRPTKRTGTRMLVAIAASALLILGVYLLFRSTTEKPDMAISEKEFADDIAPGGNHATLMVAGEVTHLGQVSEGRLLTPDATELEVVDNGLVKYSPGASKEGAAMVHTLSTPPGGQYSVVLEDGSRVWLNASSSLSYPAVFSGDERTVKLTGEGYFEVAPAENGQKRVPFVVEADDMEITVTGTAFNVNAYNNEPVTIATLEKGAVEVRAAGGDPLSLTAGEQAVWSGEKLEKKKPASVGAFTAWKNNLFEFRNADIQSIMRQIERWYKAEVVYKGKVNGLFNATVSRDVPVSKLLHYLQLTGRVQFDIKDHIIFVNSKEE